MSALRVALVGSSGFAADRAAPALVGSPLEFAGVLGSTPDRGAALAGRLGTSAYASLDELLGDDSLDAVWVAAHDVLHEPFGVACMDAGKHVLMEKPMAPSAAGARALIAAAERNGVVLRVGCHQRFRPVYRDLHEIVAGGTLGAIGFARLQFLWAFPPERIADDWRSTLARSGGSWVTKEFGAHLLDLLLWWTGIGARVVGAVTSTHRFPIETEDSAAILLRLADGEGAGIVEVSAAMDGRTHSVEIQGTNGWVRALDVWRGEGFIERSDGTRTAYHCEDPLQPYFDELADFARALSGEPTSGADGASGLAVLELVERALAFGRAGASVAGSVTIAST